MQPSQTNTKFECLQEMLASYCSEVKDVASYISHQMYDLRVCTSNKLQVLLVCGL